MEKKGKNSNEYTPCCHFCGGKVGEISDRTDELISSLYDCAKCNLNYCNQCSYETVEKNRTIQKCLRCDNVVEKVI